MSQKKNEGIRFPTEIRVVGSYTDRLLKGMFLKPNKLQTDYYTETNKKERRKRKSTEKRKKQWLHP